MTQLILDDEFNDMMVISDILDALYGGELHSGVLKNKDGNLIKKIAGHGIPYYYHYEKKFSEIIANFSVLNKSRNKEASLKQLKELLGEEIYNLINEFYCKYILDNGSKEKSL